jgi:hypothetical protein
MRRLALVGTLSIASTTQSAPSSQLSEASPFFHKPTFVSILNRKAEVQDHNFWLGGSAWLTSPRERSFSGISESLRPLECPHPPSWLQRAG